MTDEMKLLMAMCSALGFEVARTVEVTKGNVIKIKPLPVGFGGNPFPGWKEWEFVGDGKYREVKRETVFKVVPKINVEVNK